MGIKAIQELKQQTDTVINSLQAENQSLKAELAELKIEIEAQYAVNKTNENRLKKLEETLVKIAK